MSTTAAPTPPRRVRLKRLEVRNFRKIEFVAFDVMPGVNDIAGATAQGKSTIPLAVVELLKKGGVSSRPLRNGAADGSIRAEFDDGSVAEKAIGPSGAKPTKALAGDGRRIPVDELQGWISDEIFDPLKFAALADTKAGRRLQAEMLAELVGLDTTKVDTEREQALANESAAKKAAEEYEAQAKGVQVPALPTDVPELIDEAAIAAEKGPAAEAKAANDRVREAAKAAHLEVTRADKAADEARVAVDRARKQLADAESTLLERIKAHDAAIEAAAEHGRKVAALKDPDTSTIDSRLADAKANNVRAREAEKATAEHKRATAERERIAGQARKKRDEERAAAAVKRDCDARKAAAIAQAASKMPIPGLSIEGIGADREVFLNAVPLSQASTRERMALGCALALLREPRLRLLWIDFGNELDPAAVEWLQGFLEANDADAFVVHVVANPADADGLIIEEGKVVADRRRVRAPSTPPVGKLTRKGVDAKPGDLVADGDAADPNAIPEF